MEEANIHNPSVGSGQSASSTAGTANGTKSTRERLLSLMDRREILEGEINALSAVLDTHGVNMRTPLTTFDGYPRSDIDVAQIRTTRARIIPLLNDLKTLMAEIETALHQHHAEQSASTAPPPPPATSSSSFASAVPVIEAVFAVVNSVAASSPAEQAGLKPGDKIKRFGSVGALNHDKLANVAMEMQRNENRVIKVLVERGTEGAGEDLELELTPRRDWGGRGMLGCHLLPL